MNISAFRGCDFVQKSGACRIFCRSQSSRWKDLYARKCLVQISWKYFWTGEEIPYTNPGIHEYPFWLFVFVRMTARECGGGGWRISQTRIRTSQIKWKCRYTEFSYFSKFYKNKNTTFLALSPETRAIQIFCFNCVLFSVVDINVLLDNRIFLACKNKFLKDISWSHYNINCVL